MRMHFTPKIVNGKSLWSIHQQSQSKSIINHNRSKLLIGKHSSTNIITDEQIGSAVLALYLSVICSEFLSLSQEDFIASTVIDSSNFIQLFLKNYAKRQEGLFHLFSQRSFQGVSYPTGSQKLSIYKHLRYAAISDPLIYIDSTTLNAQKLLDWLLDVSNKKIFELPLKSINKENPDQNLLWFNNNSFHHLTEWLANQFQKNILRFYFNHKSQYHILKQLRKYLRGVGNINNLLQLTQIAVEQYSIQKMQDREDQIQALREHEQKLKSELQSILMNLEEDNSKKRKRRKYRHKKSISEEKHDRVLNLNEIDVKSPQLKISIIQKKDFSEVVLIKDNKQQIKNIKQAIFQEKRLQSDQFNPQIESPLKFISKASQKTCSCSQHSQQQTEKQRQIIVKDQIFQQCEERDDELDERLNESIFIEINEQRKRKKKHRTGKNTNKIFQQFKAKASNYILNKQLDRLLDKLSTQSNSTYQSKAIAFERVRYFVKSMYPCVDAVLFGSNAVGLALPSSDIDIMLLGISSSRQQICDYLAHIGVFINSMGWIVSCSSYLNAKVPLLKLEIDTSVSYLTPKIRQDYYQNYDSNFYSFLNLRQASKGSIIKVDITISTQSSGLSPSTQLMRNWIEDKLSMHRIILALKYTLAIRGYSQNFKGGIGSYCLFVMVAAYFKHFEQKRKQSDCQILLDILKFYGQQFDNHLKVIYLDSSTNLCYIDNQQAKQRFELTQQLIFNNSLKIIDSLNNKPMSSSCHQYSSIKAEWRKIREQLLKLTDKIEVQMATCFNNTTQFSKLLANQKSFEKWANRLQNRIDFNLGSILEGKF